MTNRKPRLQTLVAQVSLRIALFEVFTGRAFRRTYYVDPYSAHQGVVTALIIRVVGRDMLVSLLRWINLLPGLSVARLAHGTTVPGYGNLHMGVSSRVSRLLVDDPCVDEEFGTHPLSPDLDRGCRTSLETKLTGELLWPIVAGVQIMRAIGVRADEVLGPVPGLSLQRTRAALLDDVPVIRWPRHGPNPVMALLAILGVGASAWRFMVRGGERKRSRLAREYSGLLALAEMVDPRTFHEKPAHGNYLASDPRIQGRLAYYVTGEQKAWWTADERAAPLPSRVVDLSKIGFDESGWRTLKNAAKRLVAAAFWGRVSPWGLRRQLRDVEKAVALGTLFRALRPAAHVYVTYPNGRTSWRHDAGLVTALARREGVVSLSYQTRAKYSLSYEHFWDAFDIHCTWGRRWDLSYKGSEHIDRYVIVGSVFLDELLPNSGARAACGGGSTLVLFTSDIHENEASHYTLDYTRVFLKLVLQGVAGATQRPRRVILKTKDPEHADLLREDPFVQSCLATTGVSFELVDRARHDIESVIAEGDVFLSIGFTTPGLDALALGKPSAFVTDLTHVNEVFGVGPPLVLRTADEVRRFLSAPTLPPDDLMDDLDPYRDGRARGRIADVLLACDTNPA